MKVICIFDYVISPLYGGDGELIKSGETYTVKSEQKGYSTFGKRYVNAYELFEVSGLWEKGIFIPVDENKFDTILKKILRVPKITHSTK